MKQNKCCPFCGLPAIAIKLCLYCASEIHNARASKKFCSGGCKAKHWQKANYALVMGRRKASYAERQVENAKRIYEEVMTRPAKIENEKRIAWNVYMDAKEKYNHIITG